MPVPDLLCEVFDLTSAANSPYELSAQLVETSRCIAEEVHLADPAIQEQLLQLKAAGVIEAARQMCQELPLFTGTDTMPVDREQLMIGVENGRVLVSVIFDGEVTVLEEQVVRTGTGENDRGDTFIGKYSYTRFREIRLIAETENTIVLEAYGRMPKFVSDGFAPMYNYVPGITRISLPGLDRILLTERFPSRELIIRIPHALRKLRGVFGIQGNPSPQISPNWEDQLYQQRWDDIRTESIRAEQRRRSKLPVLRKLVASTLSPEHTLIRQGNFPVHLDYEI